MKIILSLLFLGLAHEAFCVVDPTRFEAQSDIPPLAPTSRNKFRMADANELLRWRNATIVYQVALPAYNDEELRGLREAMDIYEEETCLKFKLATKDDPYSAIIRKGSGGCNAILGQAGTKGTQTVNLDYGCRYYGLFLHELGHTIGLHHEHQHPDRDQGVIINMDNVEPHMRVWFETIDRKKLNFYGVPYDMQSIMHYGQHAFARYENNQALISIKAKDPSKQRYLMYVYMKDLSFGDVKRINLMYKCNAHCPKIDCGDGFLNKHCKCETAKNFAQRRCFDKNTPEFCAKEKKNCNAHPSYMYTAFYNCRKTCNACYEA